MKLTNNPHSVGKTIARLRKEKGMTQSDLSEKLQISDKAVSKWESEAGLPDISLFPLLAQIFGVSIDYLLTGKESESDVVVMSKLELCAKEDNVELYKKIKPSLTTVDEDGKNILHYIFRYQSKKLFREILTNDKSNLLLQFGRSPAPAFCENFYYMRLLCGDESVIRDFIRLEYVDSPPNPMLSEGAKYSIGYDGGHYPSIPRKIVSDRMIDLVLYGKEISENLRKALLANHADAPSSRSRSPMFAELVKRNPPFRSPAFSFPWLVDYAAKKGDLALTGELLEKACNYNLENTETNNDFGNTDIFRGLVCILKSTFDRLLETDRYDLIEKANEANRIFQKKYRNNALFNKITIVEGYEIEANKIRHDGHLSEKEKACQLCIHEGILCLDELIALNDFSLYEAMIRKYPASIYEKFYDDIEKKDLRALFAYASQHNLSGLLDELRKGNAEKLATRLCSHIKAQGLHGELNERYLRVYVYPPKQRGLLRLPNTDSPPTRENLIRAKHHIFLQDVLDKDLKFIEKACQTATQAALDAALNRIAPDRFDAIDVLLRAGAKLHKVWSARNQDGELTQYDETDEIGTALLKRKIEEIVRR